jgi:hypothetical protein
MPLLFTCPWCRHQTTVDEALLGRSGTCAACGENITITPATVAQQPQPRPIEDDPMIRMLIPVGRSIWAIAAGYAGLFAVLMFPAPLALILGILAIRDIKKHPTKHGMGRAIFGLVSGFLFTIPLVFFIILAIVALFGRR